MSNQELFIVETRLNNSTKGDWKALIEGRDFTSGSSCIVINDEKGAEIGSIDLFGATDYDIEFIAYARQDILNLLNEVKYLKQQIK